jgi:hypothetical protein
MIRLRRRVSSCFECGAALDDEQALFLVTRVDPHSHAERRMTDEEREHFERELDQGQSLRELGSFGYGLGTVCRHCQDDEAAE